MALAEGLRIANAPSALVHRVEEAAARPVGPNIATAFDDELDIRTETVISGAVTDDAALHGLLGRIQGFGLRVVDVHVSPTGGPEG